MTGRVCEVHGEWCADGVCDWCEDTPDARVEELIRHKCFLPADLTAAEESNLLAQHAALRWERVARRWGSKHPRPYFWFGHPVMIAMQPMLRESPS